MDTKPAMYRQGDVLLVQVAELPKRAKRLGREGGRIVLARGEATGHAHAIADAGAGLFDAGPVRDNIRRRSGGMFLEATRTVALVHEEHAPILVKPGLYEVRRQRQWSDQGWQRVAD